MGEFLRCDAEGCDHVEDVAQLSPEMVGKLCPKCGANLLTKADFDAALPAIALFRALEKAGLVMSVPPGCAGAAGARVRYNHHNGKTTMEIIEEKKLEAN